MDMPMFCFQCQETAGCKGCTRSGVCGKTPDVAAMQDLLIYVTKGISQVASVLRAEGKEVTKDTNHLVTTNLFTTITNANFNKEAIIKRIEDTLVAKKRLLAELSSTEGLPEAALWEGARDSFEEKARTVGVLATEDEESAPSASSSPTASRASLPTRSMPMSSAAMQTRSTPSSSRRLPRSRTTASRSTISWR